MPSTTARPWVCPCCGAVTTEAGRRLMGPLCWLCGGTLYHEDEDDENSRCRACGAPIDADAWPNGCPNGPHTLDEYEGGRHE